MYKHRAQFRAKQAGVDLNEVKGGLQPNRQGTGTATRAQDVIVSDAPEQLVAEVLACVSMLTSRLAVF